MAKFLELERDPGYLNNNEIRAFYQSMMTQQDGEWELDEGSHSRLTIRHKELEGELLVAMNIPDRHFLVLRSGRDLVPLLDKLGDLWGATLRNLRRSALDKDSFCARAVLTVPLPDTATRPLDLFCSDVENV